MNVQSYINYCTGLSYYDLENFAGQNYQECYYYIKSVSDANPNHVLVGAIFTSLASNGKLAEKERYFVASFVGGMSDDEIYETAGSFWSEEAQQIAEDLVSAFPSNIQEAFVKLCIAVLCVDGNVDSYESSFLRRLTSRMY